MTSLQLLKAASWVWLVVIALALAGALEAMPSASPDHDVTTPPHTIVPAPEVAP